MCIQRMYSTFCDIQIYSMTMYSRYHLTSTWVHFKESIFDSEKDTWHRLFHQVRWLWLKFSNRIWPVSSCWTHLAWHLKRNENNYLKLWFSLKECFRYSMNCVPKSLVSTAQPPFYISSAISIESISVYHQCHATFFSSHKWPYWLREFR